MEGNIQMPMWQVIYFFCHNIHVFWVPLALGSGWYWLLSRNGVEVGNTWEQNINCNLLLLDFKIRKSPKGQEVCFHQSDDTCLCSLSVFSSRFGSTAVRGHTTDVLKGKPITCCRHYLWVLCCYFSVFSLFPLTSMRRCFLHWCFYKDFSFVQYWVSTGDI